MREEQESVRAKEEYEVVGKVRARRHRASLRDLKIRRERERRLVQVFEGVRDGD